MAPVFMLALLRQGGSLVAPASCVRAGAFLPSVRGAADPSALPGSAWPTPIIGTHAPWFAARCRLRFQRSLGMLVRFLQFRRFPANRCGLLSMNIYFRALVNLISTYRIGNASSAPLTSKIRHPPTVMLHFSFTLR